MSGGASAPVISQVVSKSSTFPELSVSSVFSLSIPVESSTISSFSEQCSDSTQSTLSQAATCTFSEDRQTAGRLFLSSRDCLHICVCITLSCFSLSAEFLSGNSIDDCLSLVEFFRFVFLIGCDAREFLCLVCQEKPIVINSKQFWLLFYFQQLSESTISTLMKSSLRDFQELWSTTMKFPFFTCLHIDRLVFSDQQCDCTFDLHACTVLQALSENHAILREGWFSFSQREFCSFCLRCNSPSSTRDQFSWSLHDLVVAVRTLPEFQDSPEVFCQKTSFSQEQNVSSHSQFFLLQTDPWYILVQQQVSDFWDKRVAKKRAKVAARQRYFEFLKRFNISNQVCWSPDHLSRLSVKELTELFTNRWLFKHFQPELLVFPEKKTAWRVFHASEHKFPSKYTDVWSRPPGTNFIIINNLVQKFYRFQCGSHFFPINFRPKGPGDFFKLNHIPDGSVLNPPYSRPLLDRIIARLVQWAFSKDHTYAVLLPFKPTEAWFKVLTALNTPHLFLKTPLAFRSGCKRFYATTAPFNSVIFLIGAFSVNLSIHIHNDKLGFPLNFDFVRSFRGIKFPRNVQARHGLVNGTNFAHKARVLTSILQYAERVHSRHESSDISHTLDFQFVMKYNHFLQKVGGDIDALNSHLWAVELNPWLASRVSWSKIRDAQRIFHRRSDLERILDQMVIEPRNRYRQARCNICRGMGHLASHCHSKVHSASKLGLTSLLDKILYEFLSNLEFSKSDPMDHFASPEEFSHLSKGWLSKEATFWARWHSFAITKGLKDPQTVFLDEEFSKGRKALGFNFALGAPLHELILDAFGAYLPLVDAPPPCEFVHDIKDGLPVFKQIDPALTKEDESEVLRRTQYIVPKQYIRYIMPRFVVINNDTTSRCINDCRLLGPHTTRYRFRLETPRKLASFSPNDIILSIDGKSAYKQRKLCWASRCLIGFRTVIDSSVCYVTMATPPFGLHNAGHIYQKALEAKLHRIAGGRFWIEYIDDISIRIASREAGPHKIQWICNAFLWLLTKCGEIVNNKFYLFKDTMTMLGVTYNLKTNRFLPKLNSFYKFGEFLLETLQKQQISLKTLEVIAGKANWLCDQNQRMILRPLYQMIGNIKKQKRPSKASDHRKIQKFPVEHNVLIHQCIIDILAQLTHQISKFDCPNFESQFKILHIAVDTNPTIAGGYMFFKNRTFKFENISPPVKQDRIPINGISSGYIRDMGYLKLLHSHQFEGNGLLKYLQKHKAFIKRVAQHIDQIKVFGDNLGLIQNLQLQSSKKTCAHTQHLAIIRLLESFDVPFSFIWLRRSTSIIELADQLGRDEVFSLSPQGAAMVEEFFNTEIFIPELFLHPLSLPIMLPAHKCSKLNHAHKTPVCLLPLRSTARDVQQIATLCTNLQKKVLVGSPMVKRSTISELFSKDRFVFEKITSAHFSSPGVTEFPNANTPYVIGYLLEKEFHIYE